MKKQTRRKTSIPEEIKNEVMKSVEDFNRENFGRDDCFYEVRFQGKFCYLDRSDYGRLMPVFRLTYTGGINKWQHAIFKWSTERYDPEEWMFPGIGYMDGTINGAMLAGLEAYPV
jgi:hypothetical protein